MLPNSAGLVCDELKQALARGAEDYWLVNCSNVKPHLPLLDLIARLWQTGEAEPVGHSVAYAQSYYGTAAGWAVAKCLRHYAGVALAYGPHEDDHAGDQFYNHVPRMLITQFIAGRDRPAESLRWLCGLPALSAQANWCADRYAAACASYDGYLRECEATAAILTGPARTLFQDSLLLQARLYAFWSEGALGGLPGAAGRFCGGLGPLLFIWRGGQSGPIRPPTPPCGPGNTGNGLTFTPMSAKLMSSRPHSCAAT